MPDISRADLLRCLLLDEHLDFDSVAASLGFVRDRPSHEALAEKQAQEFVVSPTLTQPQLVTELPPIQLERMHFYRVTRREHLQTLSETSTSYPDWYEASNKTLLDDERVSLVPEHLPLKFKPLAPWSRLWPFLHRTLSNTQRGTALDVEQLVRRLARGESVRRLPYKTFNTWSCSARLLIDINIDLFPLRHDFIFLHDRLLRLRGEYGLRVQYLDDQPGGEVYCWDNEQAVVERWSIPDPETPFLILSDLGSLTRSRRTLNNWLVLGRELAMKGCRPVVLMPVPVRLIDARLLTYFDCVCWDKGSRLKVLRSISSDQIHANDHQAKVNQLLCRLAPAVRINNILLRESRYLSSGESFDIGHEAAVWQHPSIQSYGDEFVWHSSDHEFFLQGFRKLPDELQQAMIDLIARYHSRLPEVLYFEAMLNCIQLASAHVDSEIREAAERYMAALVRTCEEHPEYQGLKQWENRFLGRQKAEVLRRQNKIVAAIEGIRLNRSAEIGQEINYPAGIDKELITPFLSKSGKKTLELRQKGRELVLFQKGREQSNEDFSSLGSLLSEMESGIDFLLRQSTTQQNLRASHILKFNPEREMTIALAGTRRYELETDLERIAVEPLVRPDWAVSIGNDADGLYVESRDSNSNIRRWYWHSPEWRTGEGILSGFWFNLPASAASLKPDWADAADRDQYGLYADVEILKITQRFRWIEPTSFLMGSPEDEAGRYGSETQHTVILTQGYWLAETACTQALWEAVMRSNPREFKGGMRPVENVSWNDIQNFLEQLNKQHSELNLRLPTEAEWENACRAGTTGAFNFDGELSLDKVNYRGTWDDYNNWGEGALQQTTDVKDEKYRPNAWGLYQMHGNVWEWCQDWFGDYPAEPVIDPKGAESGGSRVLRGGSWGSFGRICRSAYRSHYDPSARDFHFGFRLARGHELQSVRSVRAGQQPAGSHAGGARGGQTGDGLRGGEE